MNRPWGQKVNGEGHVVIACTASVGMHVDMTAGEFNEWNAVQALMSLFVLASRDGWVNIMYTGLLSLIHI